MKAVKCPLCYGSGKIGQKVDGSLHYGGKWCHGCKGKGWVEVPE